MPVDVYATQGSYLDHLAPVWHALPAALRGRIYVESNRNELARPAARLGLDRDLVGGRPPWGDDPVLAAGGGDLPGTSSRPVILLEHGAGQTYRGVDGPSYSGGIGRDAVRLFLCPNQTVADRNLARYPTATAVVVGGLTVRATTPETAVLSGPGARPDPPIPGADEAHELRDLQDNTPGQTLRGAEMRAPRPDWNRPSYSDRGPVIGVTFHWPSTVCPEAGSGWDHWGPTILRLGTTRPVVGHAHPRIAHRLLPWWESYGIQAEADPYRLLDVADVLAVDNSSLGFQAMREGIPVVWLNTPAYRRDVAHGLRFWEVADHAPTVDTPDGLDAAIGRALERRPDDVQKAASYARTIYPYVGRDAVARAVDAILELCGS